MRKRINRGLFLVAASVVRLLFWTKAKGKENIPEGGCLICPNHTTASDPISVILGLGLNCDYTVMAKAELFKNQILAWLLRSVANAFPVNREGNDLGAIRLGTKALKEGKKLILFPEGTRRRDGKLGPAKAGAGMFALRAGVPVVPVYITPGKKLFRCTTVRFGEAFYPECVGEKHSEQYQNASDQIMERIAVIMSDERK